MKHSLLNIKQITRLIVVSFVSMSCVSCATQAEWSRAFQSIAKFAGQMTLGAADEIVQKSNNISDEDKANWSSITSSSGYASDAGRRAVNGDYLGSITSIVANTAELMGADSYIVERSYVAANKALEGDYYGAGLDVAQISMNATGDYSSDMIFDTYRQYNEIQIEYNKNIRDGMRQEEALDKKNERVAELIVSTQEMIAARRKANQIEQREQEAQLKESGWTDDEVEMLQIFGIRPSYTDVDGNTLDMSSSDDYSYYGTHETDETIASDSFEKNTSNQSKLANSNQPEKESSLNIQVEEENINAVERGKAIVSINETKASGYKVGEAKLSHEITLKLDNIAEKMNQHKDIKLTIYGHTCDIGTKEKNEIVGAARAQAAKDYLVNHGIDGNRITIESKSNTCPLVENIDEEHRKQNRRVEFMAR